MHRLLPPGVPSQWWSPALSPRTLRLFRPLRRLLQKRAHRIVSVDVRGLDHLRNAVGAGHGVLVTPNHHTYTDPLLLSEAADQAGTAFYYMTAWQVFATSNWVKQQVLRRCGCFSVDRDGADLRAFRQAVAILKDQPHPLVLFPEGELSLIHI